ncbi:MAG: Ig-like domain-containing protein [Tannerellaceae bacterium]|nr:Ig-like domain-containing protein [Tannerellaceae bacterium]
MKHILKYSLSWFLLAATFWGLASCSDDDTRDIPAASYPASVKLIVPEELQPYIYTDTQMDIDVLPLLKGESVVFGYSISPVDVTFNDVEWTSNNESVATVDQEGKVTAISGDGLGYAVIQVAPDPFFAGSNIFGTLRVDVSNTLVPARTITINSADNQEEVFIGETLQLSASILPEDATYKTVKWTSSDETIATVDLKGVVTGVSTGGTTTMVTITATSLDGMQVMGSKEITVKQIVEPEEVNIDQAYSINNGYLFAIADKKVVLNYTTVPAISTTSLIEWETSNSSIATVNEGIVTFNQSGVFGDVTITATCPETRNSSSITLRLEAGLIRELFHDPDNYTWYNAEQSGNGTSSSHEWSYGKMKITTYTQNDTNQRGDFKCWETNTWLYTGDYPIFAIRMDDVMDLYDEVTSRAINLDVSGSANGEPYSGNVGGNNNQWANDYKCSDGSHVFVYDLSTQGCANGGVLPANSIATFTTFQIKYADIRTLTRQVTYNVYWIQTFKSLGEVEAYITSEGLTYTKVK